jgi:hypothetical protein
LGRCIFTNVGRYPDALERVEAELNAAGTDYVWPAPVPHPDSLHRTLAAAVRAGRFTATGNGTRSQPFRFGLAGPTA